MGKSLYAILSGLMLTAAFPPASLEWMAWFALVPLLKALRDESPSRAFRLGCLTGLVHYFTLIYWIIVVLGHYGGLNVFLSLGVLGLFCLYLSLYPALFSVLTSICRGSRFGLFLIACGWVGLEYMRANVLTGFPWCLLGYSQYRMLTLIQMADLMGVYGLSFLIIFANALIYALLFDRTFSAKGFLKWEAVCTGLLLAFALIYGHQRISGLENPDKTRPSFTAAIVQGNVDQSVKWHPQYQQKTIEDYERLTLKASAFHPALVVWPETAVPFFFQDGSEYTERVIQIVRKIHAELIFGSPAYTRENGAIRYHNRAYSLSSTGEISGFYDKTHLVPFGEYVPMSRFFPFVHRLVPAAGDFASGDKNTPLKLSRFTAGTLICFEIIFPELARAQTNAGADLLINLTNDAWFGMTSAPFQHLSMAVFRAVENRRFLIRSANTGFSAFVSPLGEIIQQGSLFQEEVLLQDVRPLDGSPGFYTRHGDLFAFGALIISLIKTFFYLCYRIKNKSDIKALHGSASPRNF
ncbi:MAG: apolipoprotein N-acyltransferase [Desulfatiglandales bacterium]